RRAACATRVTGASEPGGRGRAAHRAGAAGRPFAVGCRRQRRHVIRRRARDPRGRGTASGRAGISPAPAAPWGRRSMTARAPPMVLMSDEEVAAYGRNPDAGFGALETARGPLPLIAMEIDARVSGVIASIEVAQRFVNPTAGALEATYIFPLPD